MNKFLAFVLVCTQGIAFTRGENELFEKIIEHTMECVAQSPKDFSMEICQEMLLPGNDNSLAKYDACKCIGACAAKRIHLLNEAGEYDIEKFRAHIASTMQSEIWNKEVDVIFDKCKNIRNTGNECEYVYQWTTCVLSNSKLASEWFKTFVGQRNEESTGTK